MSESESPAQGSRLGFWTLIIGVGFLVAAIPLQLLINVFLRIDGAAGMILSTFAWLLWLTWLIAAIVLFIVWIIRTARGSGKSASAPVIRQPAGWYPDPYGSGRLRWWDGTVWRDQYADPPTPS